MDILSRSGDIRDQSRRLYKIDRNFACFWPPIFEWGELPEFLESIYKIDTGSDHVAKFRGDRPRELGDLAAKKEKKENITSKIEDVPYYRTGRSNKTCKKSCKTCASFAGLLISFTVVVKLVIGFLLRKRKTESFPARSQ